MMIWVFSSVELDHILLDVNGDNTVAS